jgi:large subunit ribosomal protein L3
MKFILAKKIGMSQVFKEDGLVVPVTRVQAGPCQITQVNDENKKFVQIGLGEAKKDSLPKPQSGHLKDLKQSKWIKEFAVESVGNIKRGDEITVETFSIGDKVNVFGESKGKGFAGVVKRHHFAGAPASHGHKHDLRAPGSIGAGGVQRVFKGMRMAGRMGGNQVTVKNLEIVEIHPENDELYIKGAVPGGKNGLIVIIGNGELKIKTSSQSVEQNVSEPTSELIIEEKPEEKKEEDKKEKETI